ncbi:MAG: amino acid adenylation domain-containing protein [Pseudomonadota bacterium]
MHDVPHHYPLTASQLRFWHGSQLMPDAPVYTMVWRFDLYQQLDPARFAKALETVVARSEALCLRFGESPEGPIQLRGTEHFSLPAVKDLSCASTPESALQNLIPAWIARPFDLSRGTYRAMLVKLAEDHWVWLSAQHHIACDAQSGALLFTAVSAEYLAPGTDRSEHSWFNKATRLAADAPAPEKNNAPGQIRTQAPAYGAVVQGMPASVRVGGEALQAACTSFDQLCGDRQFRMITPDLTRLALFSTAWIAFQHRVCGNEQIVTGLPSHNRLTAQDRETMGLFVEVLPLSTTVLAEDTFDTLFKKVRATLGTFLRQAKPNAASLQTVSKTANILNYVQAKFDSFAGAPARAAWLHSGAHDPQNPLRLHVVDFDGLGPKLTIDVSHAVAQQTKPQRVAEHFSHLLDAVTADRKKPISEISLCSLDEISAISLLSVGRQNQKTRPTDVLSLIEQQVHLGPDAIAARQGTIDVTYEDLWRRAGSIAAALQEDCTRENPVAVHMHRSVECLAAILGVMRSGRAFVPIAANTPVIRLSSILKAAGAQVAVGDERTSQHLVNAGVSVLEAPAQTAIPQPTSLTKNAYILYTSGSTGEPKGVVVGQEGFARYIAWAAESFSGADQVDYAFFSSLSFDLTMTSLFVPLITGGTVVVYPETGENDLAVLDVFADDAVDVVKLTPSHLSLVCEVGKPLKRVSTLVLGGENLPANLCRLALEKLSPKLKIINEYGPTESIVGCMIHRFQAESDKDASVPIGRPAAGVTVTVRSAALSLQPIGVKGEICISGRLAEGYMNRPDLTAEKFLRCEDGMILYRTGDIGRLRSDGTLEYFGRIDQQLKLGGVRIETAEIENAVLTVADVTAAYVHSPTSTPPSVTPQFCTSCGLPDTYPGANFSKTGLCSICDGYQDYKDRARAYFRSESDLETKLRDASQNSRGDYDAMMLLSGGKDSTYAAYRLAALTSRVLAVTLDNGFLSDEAKENINRVSADLGWTHRYLSTNKMNEIFVESLNTHSNVCQGCFKALYTLAIRTARAEGVPVIVTGLSRGQFFETRLTPELFANDAPTCAQLEDMVTEARRQYHREDDAVARLLETSDLSDGRFLEEIEILDIYRFIDVPVSEIYRFLQESGAWRRPSDTGRSTNCLINNAGIFVHQKREGFHNYALPYSWDVRMGQKTRDEALNELNDDIDEADVQRILRDIGFDTPLVPRKDDTAITVYVAAGASVSEADIWGALRDRLPRETQPSHIVLLDRMPLTSNGKVATSLLPRPSTPASDAFVPPAGPLEHRLAAILCKITRCERVGRYDSFFDLGVDSLAAIRIAMQANEDGIALPATALFEHRTLAALAASVEKQSDQAPALEDTGNTLDLDLDAADLAALAKALS